MTVDAPKCAVCGSKHWMREPHKWDSQPDPQGSSVESVRTQSTPSPQSVRTRKSKPGPVRTQAIPAGMILVDEVEYQRLKIDAENWRKRQAQNRERMRMRRGHKVQASESLP